MPAYKMCRYLGPRVKPGDCGDCDRLCQHDPSYGVVRLSTRCGQPGKCPDYEPKTGLQRLPQVDDLPQLEGRVVREEEVESPPVPEVSNDVLPGDTPDDGRPRRRRSSKKKAM